MYTCVEYCGSKCAVQLPHVQFATAGGAGLGVGGHVRGAAAARGGGVLEEQPNALHVPMLGCDEQGKLAGVRIVLQHVGACHEQCAHH